MSNSTSFADMVLTWDTTEDYTYNPTPVEKIMPAAPLPLILQSGVSFKVNLKGPNLSTQVTATAVAAAAQAPVLADWDVGWIQIIGVHTMEAKWKAGKIVKTAKWRQSALPCYDSDAAASIPWYNKSWAAPKPLAPAAPVTVTINDAPAMTVYERHGDMTFQFKKKDGSTASVQPLQNQSPNALLFEMTKKLSFEMYLAIIKRNAIKWKSAANMRLLQKITWETELVVKRNLTSADFDVITNTISHKSAINYEDSTKPPALTLLPKDDTQFANGSILVTRT